MYYVRIKTEVINIMFNIIMFTSLSVTIILIIFFILSFHYFKGEKYYELRRQTLLIILLMLLFTYTIYDMNRANLKRQTKHVENNNITIKHIGFKETRICIRN